MSTLTAGTWVERRHPRTPDERFGRIVGRCHPEHDSFYVCVNFGYTFIDPGRDLRPAELPARLTRWWEKR